MTNHQKAPGIAIVAPGGYAPDNAAVERAVNGLQAQGCKVFNYYRHEARYQRFGGTDESRLQQIEAAASHPEVDLVIALRGGYGMSRLLHQLDFEKLAASGKLFVGHSDFTAFQMALLAETAAISFSGPMICDDFTRADSSAFTMQQFWSCLQGPGCAIEWRASGNPDADLDGIVWGGNLTMLTQLIGTKWTPAIGNGILFIEDIHEHPYRIERMLLHLLHSGILDNQQALLLGDFTQYATTPYDNGYDFAGMLEWIRKNLPIPVFTGLPFGHVQDKVTFPLGATARFSSENGSLKLVFDDYPNLGHLQLPR